MCGQAWGRGAAGSFVIRGIIKIDHIIFPFVVQSCNSLVADKDKCFIRMGIKK